MVVITPSSRRQKLEDIVGRWELPPTVMPSPPTRVYNTLPAVILPAPQINFSSHNRAANDNRRLYRSRRRGRTPVFLADRLAINTRLGGPLRKHLVEKPPNSILNGGALKSRSRVPRDSIFNILSRRN